MIDNNNMLAQIDLFGASPTPAENEEHVAAAGEPAFEDPGERDARAYEASLDDFRRTVHAMASQLQEHRSQHGRFAGTFEFSPEDRISERTKAIFEAMINMASESFGAYGNPIEIDSADAHERFFPVDDYRDSRLARAMKEAKRANFSPVALWQYLTSRYRASGRNQALSESAARIVHQFPFGRLFDDYVKVTPSATTFGVTIWTEKPGKHVSNCAFQLGYRHTMIGESKNLHSLMCDLAVFLAWAHNESEIRREFQSDVATIRDWLFHGQGCFDSRFKQQLGPITLQWFKDKVEFRFPAPLAEKLNLFLTEYAGEALASMMAKRA